MLYNKNIFYLVGMLYGMFFLVSGLDCMNKDQEQLFSLGELLMPADVCRVIQSYSTLQSIGRLKCVNKAFDNDYKNEHCFCSQDHLSFTCKELKKDPYARCTKVLVHYAATGNEAMFLHMWLWKRSLRNYDLQLIVGENISSWTLKNKMDYYCHCYNGPKKQDEVYCKQIISSLLLPNDHTRNVLKKTLQDSGFNIYESPCRKKYSTFPNLRGDRSYYTRRWLFNRMNLRRHDIDFFLLIMGGAIQPNMFKSLFKYMQLDTLKALNERGCFSVEKDKHGKSALDYYQKRMRYEHRRDPKTYPKNIEVVIR